MHFQYMMVFTLNFLNLFICMCIRGTLCISVSWMNSMFVCLNSWPSVFPESPRWLLATSQIPEAKRCLQLFTTRNGVCRRDEIYSAETLLTGTSNVASLLEGQMQLHFYALYLPKSQHRQSNTSFYLKRNVFSAWTSCKSVYVRLEKDM